ncbi:MAG: hypothetical protein HGA98_05300, partial [Deltaproteobacteria bacterium]|nr:hypothetical protein [Deltaproteobacteria bacterium]
MNFKLQGTTLTLDELVAREAAAAQAEPLEPPAVSAHQYDRSGAVEEVSQVVSAEKAVTLYINGRELVTLLCVGHHLEELAVGYLHAEGFLQRLDDLLELEVDDDAGKVHVKTAREEELANALYMKRTVTSGCGKGSLFYYALNALLAKPVVSGLRVAPRQVLDRIDDLSRSSASYRRTGQL